MNAPTFLESVVPARSLPQGIWWHPRNPVRIRGSAIPTYFSVMDDFGTLRGIVLTQREVSHG